MGGSGALAWHPNDPSRYTQKYAGLTYNGELPFTFDQAGQSINVAT
jgi:hypothetical protein